ncbi:DUF4097 family beta strand repeat-containing protein [Pseudonocardia sp. CA-107938]|uniref:DUF4097 family beta strand repeat-containing protein n=1 Tax=Pseudonocardia sp. CA-107938 TaxID=3240021 RepID=UPI003D9136B4
MPTFATPQPISATIELSVGNVQLVASDRTDTVVEVHPTNPADQSDVEAAGATRVDHVDGVLTVRGPKSRMLDFSRKTRSVDVVVELPSDSRVTVDLSVGDCSSSGVLGDCRVKNSVGQVKLYRTGPLRIETAAGDIVVDAADGNTDVNTGSGQVRIGAIGGSATVKNANGNTDLGDVDGTLRVRAANGNISVDRAGADVEATTANGSIRIGEVVSGRVGLDTSFGGLELGIAEGTAAWLDLKTGFGRVRNSLDAGDGPGKAENTVEVRAHTAHGDITVGRAR